MKTRRIIIGTMFAVAGVAFTACAVFVVQAAQDEVRLTERGQMAADTVCREQMQKMGPVKELEAGRVLELSVPVVVDKRTALGDASAAIAACTMRTMQSFCIGPGCNDPEGARPPVGMVRRPSAMVMRMALRPGAVAAPQQQAPAAVPPRPGPPVAAAPPPPRPVMGQQPAQPAMAPGRPPVPAQVQRPGLMQPPQAIPQVK